MKDTTYTILHSAFSSDRVLVTCSLLGSLASLLLTYDTSKKLKAEPIWRGEVKEIAKVNTISLNVTWLIVGGLAKGGKGIFEIWDYDSQTDPNNPNLPGDMLESSG